MSMILAKNLPIYKELSEVYEEYFSLNYLSLPINEKFILINLLGLLTVTARKKNNDVKTIDVLNKILSNNLTNYDTKFLMGLSIVVDDFIVYTTNFDNCGLKSSQEIIDKIISFLNLYLPFNKDMPDFLNGNTL